MTPSNRKKAIILCIVAAVLVCGVGFYLLARTSPSMVSLDPAQAEKQLVLSTTNVEGPATSTVTIVEFLDYQCPSCGAFNPTMVAIRKEYAGKIRYAVRLFPLTELHPNAKGAAIAAVCAGKQGHFFDYGDLLFNNQDRLDRNSLILFANSLGLDANAFSTCLDDPTVAAFVASERADADRLGLDRTPTIFVNGAELDGVPTQAQLEAIINPILSPAPTLSSSTSL
ncbi:MAG: thioredoxin domain-containing protein [Patescibacteria group bacterium]